VFRSPREKLGRLYDKNDKLIEEITWVVNSKEEAERVVEFMKGQDKRMVRAIKSGQGKDRVEVEMPEFV
jgi:D-serine deaminase-like pyridoxal phosphate-dependent protein